MKSLQRQFVLAGPKMDDPNFRQSVILMIDHHAPTVRPDGTLVIEPGGEEDDEHSGTAPSFTMGDPSGPSGGEAGDGTTDGADDAGADAIESGGGSSGGGTQTLTGIGAGALGLVINHELPIPVDEAWRQVSDQPCRVGGRLRRGGPCPGPLMLLHRVADRSQREVIDGVHLTVDEADVRWLMEQHGDEVLVFTGYSGWALGQLEYEVDRGAWLAVPASANELFAADVGSLWRRMIAKANPTLGRVVRNPGLQPPDPNLN